ncbi:MAG: TDP-4-oxo-6-deoxy-alpha-D-glucose-3,4-oxoisomerase [Anaerolineae bacterium]|nr:TDP-4-oxo-6-deoxy-alpha-D-glucose-3,4-oxoisomerase [Anaerolineae bacterium]
MTTINDCKIIELSKITTSTQGSLTPIYSGEHIPFDIARVYYLYDVPGGAVRGGHAHKELQQLIVAAMGAFSVVLDDGYTKKTFVLNRAYLGLYVPQFIWRELVDFSSGGICLVLASHPYNENDYIRDYEQFLRYKHRGNSIS